MSAELFAVLAPFFKAGLQVRLVGLQYTPTFRVRLACRALVRESIFAGRLVVDVEVSCDRRQVLAFGMSFSDLLVPGERPGLSVRQQLDESMLFEGHDGGAVASAFALGPVIDAED